MQIKQLILETSKLDILTKFYGTILELSLEKPTHQEIRITIGNTELIFQEALAADPFYHFAINIPANKIEESRDWLKSRVELTWLEQYKSDIADFANWDAKSVYFFDPAGNILELIARFDLDNKSPDPFSSAQFLSISEVGLVFKEDAFDKRTESLLQQYHLSYFDKQPPLPQFRAVGDDEGLFIIVPEGRNWFATNMASRIFPLEVEFENEGMSYKLAIG